MNPALSTRLRRTTTTLGFAVALAGTFAWFRFSLWYIQLVARASMASPLARNPVTIGFGDASPVPDLVAHQLMVLVVLAVVLSLVGRAREDWLARTAKTFGAAMALCALGFAALLVVVWASDAYDRQGFLALLPVFAAHVAAGGLLISYRLRPTRWALVGAGVMAFLSLVATTTIAQPLVEPYGDVLPSIYPTVGTATTVAVLAAGVAALSALAVRFGLAGPRPAGLTVLLALPPLLAAQSLLAVGYLGVFASLCSRERDTSTEASVAVVVWILFAAVAVSLVGLALRRWRR